MQIHYLNKRQLICIKKRNILFIFHFFKTDQMLLMQNAAFFIYVIKKRKC